MFVIYIYIYIYIYIKIKIQNKILKNLKGQSYSLSVHPASNYNGPGKRSWIDHFAISKTLKLVRMCTK